MIDKKRLWILLFSSFAVLPLFATDLDTIGLTRLLANQPGLNAAGLTVGQPEAGNGAPAFEINPATVGEPQDLFSWISTNGVAISFPNDIGTESGHADAVADNFFVPGTGLATGVGHVDNYDADYFVNYVVPLDQSISDTVVNQSFVDTDLADVITNDNQYDDYVAAYGTIFCSAVGNGGPVYSPATAYNVIGVGCYGIGAGSSVGPTTDNGRSKPDLVAPSLATSFSTPYVSGAAAVLFQAAGSADAQDVRTIKALLLNGAIKPFGWTHTPTAPLDTHYGSGLLNIYYSYEQLAAGQTGFSNGDSSSTPENSSPISSLLGWGFETFSPDPLNPAVNHYCFDITNASGFTLTSSVVWERASGASGVNQITLSLYNFNTGALVAQSVSSVDNVQHLYVPVLPSGDYDLQVARAANLDGDDYALAFQFFPIAPIPLSIAAVGTNLTISWPATPTIYALQQTTSLNPPISWSAAPNSQLLTNGQVVVNFTPPTAAFYRLLQ